MRNKLITMQQAVEKYTRDGMTYCHGSAYPVGADTISFGREMVRQGRKNLNMISHCGSQQINLLAVHEQRLDIFERRPGWWRIPFCPRATGQQSGS